jgi:hypothetical protein
MEWEVGVLEILLISVWERQGEDNMILCSNLNLVMLEYDVKGQGLVLLEGIQVYEEVGNGVGVSSCETLLCGKWIHVITWKVVNGCKELHEMMVKAAVRESFKFGCQE